MTDPNLHPRDFGPDLGPGRTAVFAGTFDPPSLGHLDVIRRGSRLFDHLIVGIGLNPNKVPLFDIDQRLAMVRRIAEPYQNVRVEAFHELAVQFVRRVGAQFILRGLRTVSDMEYEFSMSLTNQRLDPEIETVYLMADGQYAHVSSSLVKQIAQFGGRETLAKFVPESILDLIMERFDPSRVGAP